MAPCWSWPCVHRWAVAWSAMLGANVGRQSTRVLCSPMPRHAHAHGDGGACSLLYSTDYGGGGDRSSSFSDEPPCIMGHAPHMSEHTGKPFVHRRLNSNIFNLKG